MPAESNNHIGTFISTFTQIISMTHKPRQLKCGNEGSPSVKTVSRRRFMFLAAAASASFAVSCAAPAYYKKDTCGSVAIGGILMNCAPGQRCRVLAREGDELINIRLRMASSGGGQFNDTALTVAGITEGRVALAYTVESTMGSHKVIRFFGYGSHTDQEGKEFAVEKGRMRGTAYFTVTGEEPHLSISCP